MEEKKLKIERCRRGGTPSCLYCNEHEMIVAFPLMKELTPGNKEINFNSITPSTITAMEEANKKYCLNCRAYEPISNDPVVGD